MIKKVKILETVKIINDSVKRFEGSRPFLSTGDLDYTVIKNTEDVTFSYRPSRANQNVQQGDIIMARMQGTVKVKIISDNEENIIVSTGFIVLRCNKNIDNQYLFHYLKSSLFQSQKDKLCSGATQKAINNNKFAEIAIPLPDLQTQQKIAAILDKADALSQYNQQLIDKYDALTQSLFLEMFGDPVSNVKSWEIKKLEELCDVGSSRRVFVDELVEEGVAFYRGTEIGQMSLNENITPTLFITKEHYENLKKETGVPKIGDLLMPSICPDGRIFEVTNNNPFYFKDGRVLWIKVNKELINSIYLKIYLKAIFAVDYAKIASGTTFAELKIFALKKLSIQYPSINLQNQFAERVQAIEVQKQQAQEALAQSEALFQGLLQRAFKGELN